MLKSEITVKIKTHFKNSIYLLFTEYSILFINKFVKYNLTNKNPDS